MKVSKYRNVTLPASVVLNLLLVGLLALSVTWVKIETVIEKKEVIVEKTPRLQFEPPLDGVHYTSYFGVRKNPMGGGDNDFHRGIDIVPTSANREVKASEHGVVFLVDGAHPAYGKYVIIDHGEGVYSMYAHLERIYTPKGTVVEKGDVIGLMGSTGISTGPHLHFEVFYDPKNILQTGTIELN